MQLNSLAIFVFLCGIILATGAIYAWRNRSTRGSQMFSVFMSAITVYVLAYSLELSSLDLPSMLFWSNVGYLGIFSFPTLFLLFVLQYIGREKWLTRGNIILLFLFPTFLLWAKLSDNIFHLVYRSTWIDASGFIPLLGFSRGPIYPFALYSGIPVSLGVILLWRARQHTSPLYRKQASLVVVSTLLPLLVFILYMSGFHLFPGLEYLDINAFLYTIWGIGIGWGVFRYDLFKLAPIARDALIERLSDGIFVLDDFDRLVDANPVGLKIAGWIQAPIGKPVEQAFSDWGELRDACLLSGFESVEIEIKRPVRDEIAFFDMNVTVLEDSVGRKIGRLIVVHDITERKRIDAVQHESQETFRRYFNMGAVGMCIIAPDRHWLEVNERLCKMLDYSPAELYDFTWSDLTFPADIEVEIILFNELLLNKRDSYQVDKRFVRKDNLIVYTSTYVSSYRNPDGTARNILASIVDITERKQAAEALLKMTAMEERQRLARDLHDSVNQSIHGLMLFSETLVSTLEKGKVERGLQIAERLQESASQALKETRLMLYQTQPHLDDRGVNFIQDLEIRLLTVERHAGVGTKIIQEGSMDYCPREWYKNLFAITLEALNNALKHAQARKIQINIHCFPKYFCLEIVDNGKGFDPARTFTGGMGLQSMRERANLLDGELTIFSSPSNGTRVKFSAEIK